MKIRNLVFLIFLSSSFLSGCTGVSDYLRNVIAEDREDQIVYRKNTQYGDSQFDLAVPPDLITPSSENFMNIPEYAGEEELNIFTIDTDLENIKLIRSGRDSILSLTKVDKETLWKKLQLFWEEEGFRLVQKDYTLGVMRTGYLENLSEAQLGTIQRVIGRYVPLLVQPETRDSYKTRILTKDDSIDILLTHYGKEFMSDGENEFRWQNRPRDVEYESEMVSRLYIYLGGDEAKSKGYSIVKSTGLRHQATMNVDENGIHVLFVGDIYERVWPKIIRSLETLGIYIQEANIEDGFIKVSMNENIDEETSFLDTLAFWKDSDSLESFYIVVLSNQKGTSIEIQDDTFINFTNQASEEVIRALYSELR